MTGGTGFFGSYPSDGRIVSNLAMQPLRDEPKAFPAAGSQTRSLRHDDDRIDRFLALALEKRKQAPEASPET